MVLSNVPLQMFIEVKIIIFMMKVEFNPVWPAVTLTSWLCVNNNGNGKSFVCLLVFCLLFSAASPPTGSLQQNVHEVKRNEAAAAWSSEVRIWQTSVSRRRRRKTTTSEYFRHVVEKKNLQLKVFQTFQELCIYLFKFKIQKYLK